MHESSFLMSLPLIILALGSLFVGYLVKDLFIGLGTDFWGSSILVLPNHANFIEAEWLPTFTKWLPFCLSISGVLLANIVNLTSITNYLILKFPKVIGYIGSLANKKWYWDILYNRVLVVPILNFGYLVSFKIVDRGFIELLGPYGFTKLIPSWSQIILKLQTGQITHYIFFMILGLCFFSLNLIYDFTNYFHLFSIFFVLVFFL